MNTGAILFVDDEPDSVFFFLHAVTKAVILNPVRVARDGQDALDYLKGIGVYADRGLHPMPSLVVLDLKMPRANGFEVLRQVRANPVLRSLIVVMLTASASERDIEEAYALGANAYLVKPLRLEELVVMVQAFKDFWLTHNYPPLTGNWS